MQTISPGNYPTDPIPTEREQQDKIDDVYARFAQVVDFSPILNSIRDVLEQAENFKRQEGV